MASKSLGTLTLDLVAKIGGFTAPMDQAARKSRQSAKDIKDAGKSAGDSWSRLTGIVQGAVAGISVGAIFSKIITETKNAAAEQAQLAAVLRSTGEAAGYSQGQLNDMADTMEQLTAFAAGDVTNAQVALLAFTGIVGEQFPRALQAAADMAARTGMDIKSSAETIGRALDVPSKGMAALSRQGFRFSDAQKELIKQLESTGRSAEAQNIILAELEKTYGGAAAAAKDTLGGAYQSLLNTIDSLIGNEKGFPALKESIEELNKTINDDATRAGVDSLASGVGKIASGAVNAFSELGSLGKQAAATFANLTGNLIDEDRIKIEIDEINRALRGGLSTPLKYLFTSPEELMIIKAEKEAVLEALAGIDQAQKKAEALASSGVGFTEYNNKGIESSINDEIDARAKAQTALNNAYAAQVAVLERANALSAEATELEKIRYEFTNGNLKGLDEQQQRRLESLARERDLQEKMAEDAKKLEGDLSAVRKDLMTQEEAYQAAAIERQAILNDAKKAGIILDEEYRNLSEANTKKVTEDIEKLKEKQTELDEFTKNAARSIQSSLSDAIMAGFDGGADNLLDRWKDLLKRMVADALAADLTRSLFGQASLGEGQFGTDQLFKGVTGIFAGMFDAGGSIPSGKIGLVGERGPELVRGPATVTGRLDTERQLKGGPSISIGNMNFPGVTNAQEARKAAGAAAREILAVVNSSARYT